MIRIKEWALADAIRLQKQVDEKNKGPEAAWRARVKAAVDAGEDPPAPPELIGEAQVPQFHMSGERIFEVQSDGEGRPQVVHAIASYIKTHPRAPMPMPVQAESTW